MIINSLELMNFRNYEREVFAFDPETNVLFGDNAQGKTNVLEGQLQLAYLFLLII